MTLQVRGTEPILPEMTIAGVLIKTGVNLDLDADTSTSVFTVMVKVMVLTIATASMLDVVGMTGEVMVMIKQDAGGKK